MGGNQLKKIRQAIDELKQSINNISKNEGIMLNTVFQCQHMKTGDHHLYDEVDDAFFAAKEGGSNK